jgi:ubiquitin-conjugating enzyme E2 R
MFRDDRAQYNEKAKAAVEASKKDIPEGFDMPTTLYTAPPPKEQDDADFWNESGDEEDFGGSDSSGEDQDFDDMDEDEEAEDEQEMEG